MPGTYLVKVKNYEWTESGPFTLEVHGTVPPATACSSPLFASGVLSCPAGTTCTGTPAICQSRSVGRVPMRSESRATTGDAGPFTLDGHATVAPSTSCASPLFASGVLSCPAGTTCTGTPAICQ
ncbi:MAG: hypothetical protein AB7P03_01380 [Kofleriaceae bacterium]